MSLFFSEHTQIWVKRTLCEMMSHWTRRLDGSLEDKMCHRILSLQTASFSGWGSMPSPAASWRDLPSVNIRADLIGRQVRPAAHNTKSVYLDLVTPRSCLCHHWSDLSLQNLQFKPLLCWNWVKCKVSEMWKDMDTKIHFFSCFTTSEETPRKQQLNLH